MTTPSVPGGGSPFDAIRQERADGSEFWSARDLQPMLEYDQWRRFEETIERAMASARSQGFTVGDHFADAGKKVQLGSEAVRVVTDYHLTRFAAYLVAMNGDPRKPAVAAAQAYFAVKTREAEVTPALELSDDELMLRALTVASQRVQALTARAEAAEATVAVTAPKAEAFDSFLSAAGDYSVNEAAKVLSRDHGILTGEKRLRAWMEEHGWIYRGASREPRAYQSRIDQGVLAEKAQWHFHPVSGERITDPPQVRVTPKGLERLRTLLTTDRALEVSQ